MRLFLASHDFGNQADKLRQMVGPNRQALIITNARDYVSPAEKASVLQRKILLFARAGFTAIELDLRSYFDRKAALAQFIDRYQPGLIYAIGGNVFLLRIALKASGMDEILAEKLRGDALVYGGGSAGAMVTAPILGVYDDLDDSSLVVHSIYHRPPVMRGLHLIDEYIVPHVDHPTLGQNCSLRQDKIRQLGAHPILLRDEQVYIVEESKSNPQPMLQ